MPEGVAAAVAEENVLHYFAIVVTHDGFQLGPMESDAFFSTITDLQNATEVAPMNAVVIGSGPPSQALVETLPKE